MTTSDPIIKEGRGCKLGGFVKNWKERWFVLQGSTVRYHVQEHGKCAGQIPLQKATKIDRASEDECPKQPSFKIEMGNQRTYFVQVSSSALADEWVVALENARREALGLSPAPGSVPSSHKLSVDDFEILRVISRTPSGQVQLVRYKEDHCLYAMKALRKSALRLADSVGQVIAERNIMGQLAHPFLVRGHFAFQSSDKVFLVLDYVPGGHLFSRLRREGPFSESRTRLYAAEILLGLKYLHENGFVYRDLKPENILVDRDGHLRITDFGLAKGEMNTKDATAKTFCGTPEYIAPEMLQGKPYTKTIDWWSFGIIIYEMLTGNPPFFNENATKLYQMIVSDPVTFPEHVGGTHARNLITKLLVKEPEIRLGAGDDGASEITQHPFFQGIDWEAVLGKEIQPEWVPVLTSELDTANFSDNVDDGEADAASAVLYTDDANGEGALNLPGFTYVSELSKPK